MLSGGLRDEARDVLCRLVATWGREICKEPRRCEALLRDMCGEYRREIFILTWALREHIAEELLAKGEHTPWELLLSRLAARLHENLGIAEPFARWAVEAWAVALGVISYDELESRRTGEIALRLQKVEAYGSTRSAGAASDSGVLGRCEADVRCVAFSPSGTVVAAATGRAATADNGVRVWNLRTGEERVLGRLELPVLSIAFGPNGRWLASGGRDRRVYLWSARGGRPRLIGTCNDWVNAVAVSPDGHWIAAGGMDRAVRVWNLQARHGGVLGRMEGPVRALAFTPDSNRLLVGCEDKTVAIWDVDSGSMRVLGQCDGGVTSVAVSPNGLYAVTGSQSDWLQDNTICLWDLRTGLRRVIGNCGSVNVWAVAFGPDPLRVASGAEDGTVRLWNVETGRARLLGRCGGPVWSVAFSPDGTAVASGGRDRTLRLWPVRD